MENDECIISDEEITNLQGYNSLFNNNKNILNTELLKEDKNIFYYFKQSKNWTEEHLLKNLENTTSLINSSPNEDDIYVDSKIETIKCEDSQKNIETSILLIIIIVPTVYFLTSLCLIIFYCKYKRVTWNYERLKQELDTSIIPAEIKSSENILNQLNDQINEHNDNHLDLTENHV